MKIHSIMFRSTYVCRTAETG